MDVLDLRPHPLRVAATLLRCYADVELNETMHYETTASLLKAENLSFLLPFM